MIEIGSRQERFILILMLSLGVILIALIETLAFNFKSKPSQYTRYMEQCLKDGQPEYMCASILRGFR